MTPSHIPTFYRIFFTWVDPIMCLGGVLTHLLAPELVLKGFTPSILTPIATETAVLIDGMVGWFAGMAFLQASLLRSKPTDAAVWRAVQVAMTCVDAAMVGAFARSLRTTNEWNTQLWTGRDWGNIGGYSALVAVRVAFLMGVGVSKGKTA